MTESSLSSLSDLRINRGALYRQFRIWHGYLSALAFAALLFFSATGILLNHPEWFAAEAQKEQTQSVILDQVAMRDALQGNGGPETLAKLLSASKTVRGSYSSGEIIDGEAMLRFEGPSGSTDAIIDMGSGRADMTIKRANFIAMMGDLHRGKNAGEAWRWLIDVTAILFLLLSVIGFLLFFSLRLRLRVSLALTALGLVAMLGIAAALVY